MLGRQSTIQETYRFGFNGQEKVDEIAGEGNHNTAKFWEYDTRTGRRWNQDPKPNFSISNYAAFANNPIWFSDALGDTITTTNAFNENKIAAKGLDIWKATDEGKEFFKQYDIGGEYENVSIVLDVNSLDGRGETQVFGVDKESGAETQLFPERSIQSFGAEDVRSYLKSGEFLRFKLFLDEGQFKSESGPGSEVNRLQNSWRSGNRALTLEHEKQHIKLMHADLIKYKMVWYSAEDQHYFMKTRQDLIEKRKNVLRKARPDFSGDLKKAVNGFEY